MTVSAMTRRLAAICVALFTPGPGWAADASGHTQRTLFAGEPIGMFVAHAAHGGDFAAHARYVDGALVVEVPEGAAWGKVGLLSPDPVVWLDGFAGTAEVRVTFAFDPARTSGFAVALSLPGWGGAAGNDPGAPATRYYWIRSADGGSARTELHVDPHRQDDFWSAVQPSGESPTEVALVLRPGAVAVETDGVERARRDWPALAEGNGLRAWVFSHPHQAHAPVRMALTGIRVERTPARPDAAVDADGGTPLQVKRLFAGEPGGGWETVGVAGGDFARFGRFENGAMIVEAPAGNWWAKTGLLSTEPVLALDERAELAPTRLTIQTDPARTDGFVVALAAERGAEMWLTHQAWISFIEDPEGGVFRLGLHASPYADWVREIPADQVRADWDGRLLIDAAPGWVAARIPGGPVVRGPVPLMLHGTYYSTVLAHPPREGAAARFALRRIERAIVAPPGISRRDWWRLVDDDAFDPEAFLRDLARELAR